MALHAPLAGAAPFSGALCLLGTSSSSLAAAGFTKLPPPPPCAGKKRGSAMPMQNSSSAAETEKPANRVLRLRLRAARRGPFVVVDNGDDFTYGFCQYMCELRLNFQVYRNDEVTVDGLRRRNPRGIFISPGPGRPEDCGVSMQAIQELGPTFPIFGVCLGLQCIGEAFGGKTVSVPSDVANRESCKKVYFDDGESNDQLGLFDSFPRPFVVSRHDGRVIDRETFPHDALEVTAWTEDGLVMAARHRAYAHVQGIQFNPERVVRGQGKRIVFNFIHQVCMSSR